MQANVAIQSAIERLEDPVFSDNNAATLTLKKLRYNVDSLDKSEKALFAFLGRSGVGKSFLINRILGYAKDIVPSNSGVACTGAPVIISSSSTRLFQVVSTHFTMDEWKEQIVYLFQLLDSDVSADALKELEDCYLKYGLRSADLDLALEKQKLALEQDEKPDLHLLHLLQLSWQNDDLENTLSFPSTYEGRSIKEASDAVRKHAATKYKGVETDWRLVKHVRVHIPDCEWLKHALIIDIPGNGDSNPLRNRAHKQYLDNADHVVVVVEANRAESNHDTDYFIKKTQIQGRFTKQHLSFVLSKADHIRLGERDEDSMEEVRNNLVKNFRAQRLQDDDISVYATGDDHVEGYSNLRAHICDTSKSILLGMNSRGIKKLHDISQMLQRYCDSDQSVTTSHASKYSEDHKRDIKLIMREIENAAPITLDSISAHLLQASHITYTTLSSIAAQTIRKICKEKGEWFFKFRGDIEKRTENFNVFVWNSIQSSDFLATWNTFYRTQRDFCSNFMTWLEDRVESKGFMVFSIDDTFLQMKDEIRRIDLNIMEQRQASHQFLVNSVKDALLKVYDSQQYVGGLGMRNQIAKELMNHIRDIEGRVLLMIRHYVEDQVNALLLQCKKTALEVVEIIDQEVRNPVHIDKEHASVVLEVVQEAQKSIEIIQNS